MIDEVSLKQATATVRIQRVRGVPEPLPDPGSPEFPVVDYSYRIGYDFVQQRPPGPQVSPHNSYEQALTCVCGPWEGIDLRLKSTSLTLLANRGCSNELICCVMFSPVACEYPVRVCCWCTEHFV